MRIFAALYDKTMAWARHRHAIPLLYFVSFIEAIFFSCACGCDAHTDCNESA